MALRRTRPPVNTTEHLMAFMLKHEETIARLDKEFRELTTKIERLAAGLDALDRTLAQVPEALEGLEAKTARAIADAFSASRTPSAKPAPAPTVKNTPKTERNNRVYTPDEIALATMLWQEGATAAAIAAVLKRTERGIEGLLKRLRQGDATIGQDRHAKRKAGK